MNPLLDTHVFLWWDKHDARLSADAQALIPDPANQVFVSAASVWEIAIKRRLGKLDFRGSAISAIGSNGSHELPIVPVDAENAGALAWPRNDPFDRMPVAQAWRLIFTFATADVAIHACGAVALLWAAG